MEGGGRFLSLIDKETGTKHTEYLTTASIPHKIHLTRHFYVALTSIGSEKVRFMSGMGVCYVTERLGEQIMQFCAQRPSILSLVHRVQDLAKQSPEPQRSARVHDIDGPNTPCYNAL